MQKGDVYEYAVLRVVPRVERGEFINVGVLLLCRRQKFGAVRYEVDEQRLKALYPGIDLEVVKTQLEVFTKISKCAPGSGLIGSLPLHERFRWLTANRSTIIQCSQVHVGLTLDAAATLNELFEKLVKV